MEIKYKWNEFVDINAKRQTWIRIEVEQQFVRKYCIGIRVPLAFDRTDFVINLETRKSKHVYEQWKWQRHCFLNVAPVAKANFLLWLSTGSLLGEFARITNDYAQTRKPYVVFFKRGLMSKMVIIASSHH